MKVTFIGLGKMGSVMAERILKSGFSLTVYNRTIEKAAPLALLGATVARSIKEAVRDTEVVVTSLLDDAALIATTETLLQDAKPGMIHVSTSTILPSTAKKLEELHRHKKCIYIAACVLGIPTVLKNQKATSFVAGNHIAIEKIKPLLSTYSATIHILGETVSDANVLKISMNYTLITAIELISELYVFAEKSGIDKSIIQESLRNIYAHPAVHVYIDKIFNRDFDNVNFDVKGGNKDISLFQKAFLEVGVSPDIATILQGKFTEALATKLENKDWSIVSEVVRKRSGLDHQHSE